MFYKETTLKSFIIIFVTVNLILDKLLTKIKKIINE